MGSYFKVSKKIDSSLIAQKVFLANDFLNRLIGLMFKESFVEFDGIILDPCNSIHTFFMKMPIDVIFLDKKNMIVKVIEQMPPWRMTRMYFKANKVLELPSGILKGRVSEGDILEVVNV